MQAVSRSEGRKIVYILCLILICAAMFIPSTLKRDMDNRDELRYIEVVREMSIDKTWMVPHFGGEYYSEKPPVYFWILNLCKTVFGSYSTFAMTFPGIVSGIVGVLVAFYFGLKFFSRRYAFLAGLILATSVMYFAMASFVRMDMMMTVFITGSIMAFYQGFQQADSKQKSKYYYIYYGLMGLAILVKGPTGFLMPFVTAMVFLAVTGNWAEYKKLKLLPGFGILLGVIALWVLAIIASGDKAYAYQLFIVQTFGRAVNSFSHKRPFYYYLEVFPPAFLPWIFFLVSSFWMSIKQRANLSNGDKLFLCWFIAPFVMMSMFSGKLFVYLLPIVPAAAFLVARMFESVLEKKAKASYLVVPTICTVIVFALMAVAPFALRHKLKGIDFQSLLYGIVIPSFIFVTVSVYLLIRKQLRRMPYLIAGLMFLLVLAVSFTVIPYVSAGYTTKPIASQMKQYRENGYQNIVSCGYYQPESLSVYMGFMIRDISDDQLTKYLETHQRAIILTKEKTWEKLQSLSAYKLEKVYTSNGYILIKKS